MRNAFHYVQLLMRNSLSRMQHTSNLNQKFRIKVYLKTHPLSFFKQAFPRKANEFAIYILAKYDQDLEILTRKRKKREV